ncbi:MAG TPA: RidA family protein [Stellaceae bacterium]
MRQQSIHLPGVGHNAPIPLGARVGPILATGGVSGIDPATGKIADGAENQAKHAFQNMGNILKEGGMDWGDVVKLTVFLVDDAHRGAINKHWLEIYPDEHHRPARHSLVQSLRGGVLLQLEVLAVAKDA